MKTRSHFHRIILLGTIILVSMACSLFGPTATPVQQPSTIQPTQQPSSTTQTLQPTLDANATTDPGADPQCSVLQDLNLRFGPGTAYRPPIRALPANSVVNSLACYTRDSRRTGYVQDRQPRIRLGQRRSQYFAIEFAHSSSSFGTRATSAAESAQPTGWHGFCIDEARN